jgi:predicted metalloprotease with PDZ domain
MVMSPGTQFSFDVQFLFAHEAFHTWNPVQLGAVTPKGPIYWFSEGFTDYYARLLLLRASLMNKQQYADEINRVYSEYMSSPARNYPEQLVQAKYFNDSNAQRLPYLQGTLLALKWNLNIDEHSHGSQTLGRRYAPAQAQS